MEERQIHRTMTAGKIIGLMRYMDQTEFHLPGPIDEISLLFDSEEELDAYRAWAVERGNMVNFAKVSRDWVLREDDDGAFAVRFEFLRFPGADWRIEAMCILEGSAPLHEDWLRRFGSGCVVHASYKTANADAYARHCRQGPYVSHWPAQPTHRASYANAYGRFSYYQHPMFQYLYNEWLLKPRVNLRDTAPIASSIQDV